MNNKDRVWSEYQAAWLALTMAQAAHEVNLLHGDRLAAELTAANLGAAVERYMNAEWSYRRLLPF